MKKFLLSFALMGAVLLGNAQVLLNELYTDPSLSKGNDEFIELFNTSLSPVNLNCYSIVTYYQFGSEVGFYVMDLPNVDIPARGYVVGAAAGPFNVQGSSNINPTFSWDTLSVESSLTKYVFNGTTYYPGAVLTADQKTDFLNNFNSSGAKYAVFLFNGNTYVNGFLGGSTSANVPSLITSKPMLNFTSTNCASVTIDWSKITTAEYVGQAIGGDNGYTRNGDGICGVWDKTSKGGDHTPGTSNPVKSASSNSGGLITSETILCGTKVSFKITGTTDISSFPVTVTLYADNNSDGILNSGDAPYTVTELETNPIIVKSISNTEYSFTIAAGEKVLIEYRTALGCYYKIVAPTAITPNYVTNQYNFCNTQAGFSITSSDARTLEFGFPITVTFMYDGAQMGNSIVVQQPSTTVYYSNPFTDPTKLSIQYTPKSGSCFAPKIVSNDPTFTTVSGSFLTQETFTPLSGSSRYPQKVNVDLVGINSSINTYPTSVFPIEVRLYIDNSPENETVEKDYLGSLSIISIAELSKSFDEPTQIFETDDIGKTIYIEYLSQLSCFGKTVSRILIEESVLPVTYASFTATRSSNSQVVLEWETAMEENNRGFHVQRLVNGEWKNIGFVFTVADRGNSSSNLKYSFKDNNSSKGISQYRILQVDMDGKGRYSEVRSIRGEEMAARLTVFPNPSTNGSFNILFEDAGSLRDVIVSDVSGRAVKQYKSVSNSSLTIDNLGAGFYTVQVMNRTTGALATEKVIIKKR